MSLALPHWLRLTMVAGLLIGIAGMGWAAYRYATKPVMLAVAAGYADGEAARLMTEIATRLRTIRSHVRLKVVETGTPREAAQALAAGKVDLAVVRGDSGDLADARAVVHAADAVVLIVVPAGSSIESMDDLRGKTIGVAGGALNHGIVELLTKEYNLLRGRFVDLDLTDVRRAIETKQVNALLVVMPVTDQNLARLRALIPVHPGAAAYFDGEQQGFFDKYGDALFYGSMLLGALTTAFAALWKFMGRAASIKSKHPLHPLFAMTDRIREARSERDLDVIEENIDRILKEQLTTPSKVDADGAAEWTALSIVALRLSNLIQNRRSTLAAQTAPGIASSQSRSRLQSSQWIQNRRCNVASRAVRSLPLTAHRPHPPGARRRRQNGGTLLRTSCP